MGQKGTEAAREASAMVLADDNFASIERAVEEGRVVYDNLRKSILFLLPTNFAQAFIIVLAIGFGLMLPVTPVQILWVNMVTAVTLGIAFAWEKAEGDLMARAPHPTNEPLLTGFVLWRTVFVGMLLLSGAGLLFYFEQQNQDTPVELARTLAVNALVLGQVFYLLNTRSFRAPAYTLSGLTGNRVVLIAIAAIVGLQLLLTYAPFMNTLFSTAPLTVRDWMLCIAVGVAVFVLVEAEKMLQRRDIFPFASHEDEHPSGDRPQKDDGAEEADMKTETDDQQENADREDDEARERREATDKGEREPMEAKEREEKDDKSGKDDSEDNGDAEENGDTEDKEPEAVDRRDDAAIAEAEARKRLAEKDREIAEAERRIAEAERQIIEADIALQKGKSGARKSDKEKD